jgi:hypothetical protein
MKKAHRFKHNTYVRSYLMEAIYREDFSLSEVKTLLWLCRNTYGYRTKKGGPQRDRTTAPYEKIAEETGQHKETVGKALRALEKKNVILVYKKPVKRTGAPGTFGINSDDDTWVLNKRSAVKKPKSLNKRSTVKKGAIDCLKTEIDCLKTQENPTTTPPVADGLRSKDNVVNITERKTPLSQGVSNPSGEVDKVKSFALEIFTKIGERYYPITTPPRSNLDDCSKFAELCRQDLKRGAEALKEAFRRVLDWEERNGRRINKPFAVLDDAAFLFQQGWEAKEPEPEYYDWRTDPDYAGYNDIDTG